MESWIPLALTLILAISFYRTGAKFLSRFDGRMTRLRWRNAAQAAGYASGAALFITPLFAGAELTSESLAWLRFIWEAQMMALGFGLVVLGVLFFSSGSASGRIIAAVSVVYVGAFALGEAGIPGLLFMLGIFVLPNLNMLLRGGIGTIAIPFVDACFTSFVRTLIAAVCFALSVLSVHIYGGLGSQFFYFYCVSGGAYFLVLVVFELTGFFESARVEAIYAEAKPWLRNGGFFQIDGSRGRYDPTILKLGREHGTPIVCHETDDGAWLVGVTEGSNGEEPWYQRLVDIPDVLVAKEESSRPEGVEVVLSLARATVVADAEQRAVAQLTPGGDAGSVEQQGDQGQSAAMVRLAPTRVMARKIVQHGKTKWVHSGRADENGNDPGEENA